MAHLGADVAAYVDGQLSTAATRAADEHLGGCDECAAKVRQQRLLKSRMSTGATPAPPSDLVASLARLTDHPAPAGWADRMRNVVAVPVGLAVLGAAMTVVVVAYVMGGVDPGDGVSPPFDDYAAEFFGATAVPAAATFTEAGIARLNQQGWPCHDTLDDLERTTAAFDHDAGVVAVSYTDGVDRLRLYEQAGRLDTQRLSGFTSRSIAGGQVWVRDQDPLVVTWDHDGVVYTVVTNASRERVTRALSQLPRSQKRTPWERVGHGLTRIGDLRIAS